MFLYGPIYDCKLGLNNNFYSAHQTYCKHAAGYSVKFEYLNTQALFFKIVMRRPYHTLNFPLHSVLLEKKKSFCIVGNQVQKSLQSLPT